MSPLHRKLLRDLWRLRGQVLAIALVMASGVSVLVMALTMVESLQETTVAYYERYSFAQVFAQVERAPDRLRVRLQEIPGVQAVETRVVHSAVLDVDGFGEPVIGQLVSIPEHGESRLNRLALRQGRLPRLGAPDEVVLAEPFAEAHGLDAGEHLRAIINGRWRELTVVGTALSPEYVYAIGPGALMPDDSRFGVLWLGEETLRAAYDLQGAFNDVSLSLLRGTDPQTVIDRVDQLLEGRGGMGAYARSEQVSNWFLTNEIAELRTLSTILPTVFLAVSAFLTHMVLARLVAAERSEIGLLKAFGYRNRDIALHYVQFVLGIGAVGVILGWLLGYWLGLYDTRVYAEFFRFPFLLYRPSAQPFVIAAVITLGAAMLGALGAVRQAVALPPAEAMRPPSPPLFHRTRLSEFGFVQRLDQPTRIMLRQTARWPGRSFITAVGIGMAVAVLVTSMQWVDAIRHLVAVHFEETQRQDITVGFGEPRSGEVARELGRLPGVLTTEPMRVVVARMRFGWREEREALQGLPANQLLYRVYDATGRPNVLPPQGLVISTMLAEMLGVGIGDRISVEVLEGSRPVFEIPVTATFETYIGSPAYIEIGALNRLMGDRASVSAVHLRVDRNQRDALFGALRTLPRIASVSVKDAALQTFNATMARTITIFVSFFVVFACALAFGVTYNAARISLAERSRELATLRVLGLSRAEISYILLGEIALLVFIALPLGCVLGHALAQLMAGAFATELYRIPLVILPATYGWAIVIGIVATTVSALLVRRRVDRLDLIAVLKTRE
ncbi:MAG: FtsX-like permease family protein [Gammaproteobacteria bacterium]|nr:FtsX-like permease family protein [Gammaproteobacteria bacterium]MDH5226778.1 FtsX-like permease family protein [Gammaproteobacteria bacterium]